MNIKIHRSITVDAQIEMATNSNSCSSAGMRSFLVVAVTVPVKKSIARVCATTESVFGA